MPEADSVLDDPSVVEMRTTAALTGGQVIQLPDGRAGVVLRDKAATTTADPAAVAVRGHFSVPKAGTHAFLDGGEAWWDHSANVAYIRRGDDRDFYLGAVVGDHTTETGTAVLVDLNVQTVYSVDALEEFDSVATGTAAAGGFGEARMQGNSCAELLLTATNEAQCVDILSTASFVKGAKGIAEARVLIAANGSTSAVDINVGVANGTSTTDADAITESAFVHIDGGALTLNAESDDGTTEVAATDTTKAFVVGTAFDVWIDTRDLTSVKFYINGQRVLTGSTFVLTAATGPFKLLAHAEKTSGTATAGPIKVQRLRARTTEAVAA